MISSSVRVPGPWWPVTGTPSIVGDVDRVAGRVLGDVAGGGQEAVAALERGDRQREAFRAQVLEHREDAAVDLAGGDVFAAALVDREAVVGEDPRCSASLESSRTPAPLRSRAERVLALGAVDRRRLEQLPAVEDRLRVDPRRAAAGRADREVDVRVDAAFAGADPGQDGPGYDPRPDLEGVRRRAALPALCFAFGSDRAFGLGFGGLLRRLVGPVRQRAAAAAAGSALSTGTRFSLPVGITTERWLWTILPSSA